MILPTLNRYIYIGLISIYTLHWKYVRFSFYNSGMDPRKGMPALSTSASCFFFFFLLVCCVLFVINFSPCIRQIIRALGKQEGIVKFFSPKYIPPYVIPTEEGVKISNHCDEYLLKKLWWKKLLKMEAQRRVKQDTPLSLVEKE